MPDLVLTEQLQQFYADLQHERDELRSVVQGMETWLTDLIEDDATYQEYRELYEDVLAELTRLKAQQ